MFENEELYLQAIDAGMVSKYSRPLDEGVDPDVLEEGLSLDESFRHEVLYPLGDMHIGQQILIRDGIIAPEDRKDWCWGDPSEIDDDIRDNPDWFK